MRTNRWLFCAMGIAASSSLGSERPEHPVGGIESGNKKNRPKERCVLLGAGIPTRDGPAWRLRCSYHCPSDPPGEVRDVILRVVKKTPEPPAMSCPETQEL